MKLQQKLQQRNLVIINVIAILLPPQLKMSWGGSNAPVAEFRDKIDLELSTESFDTLINRQMIRVAEVDCRFVSMLDNYNKSSNTITLTGSMVSVDETYVARLRNLGWKFNEEKLAKYRVPMETLSQDTVLSER